jgi:hypothetical protein
VKKKGPGNVWQGNKTKVMSVIPLPIIPLPMTLLDGPCANAATRIAVLVFDDLQQFSATI